MLITMIALIIVFNVLVTAHVIRDNRRRDYEKAAESGLIWLLPVFGALVSLCITCQGPVQVREYEDVGRFFQ